MIDNSKSLKLVSIVMPAYNSEKFIAESIESILNQTYTNWELFIIDDGSIDNTHNIIKKYADNDNRIKYIFQTNQKQGKARNNGIKISNGELIAFLDSDDLWVPEKLEVQISFLNNCNADLVFSDGYIFKNNKKDAKHSFETISGYLKGKDAIELFLERNRIPILSVLVYKSAIEKVGGFIEDIEIQNVEDYHLWLKLLIKGFSFVGMTNKLVYYRQHDSQITKNDSLASEKVFYMLSNYLEVPEIYNRQLLKARLSWARDWYIRNANNKRSSINILIKIFSFSNCKMISIMTLLSLIFFGTAVSKKVIRKMVLYHIKTI